MSLVVLFALSACVGDAPVFGPPGQAAGTTSLRDWFSGATIEIRNAENPELSLVITTTFDPSGSFSSAVSTPQGVVTLTASGQWLIRGDQLCQAANPVSITRPPTCTTPTITGPDTATYLSRDRLQLLRVIARN
ncbi:hypothetical protein [Pyruvatibacter sp.]|uniref:hypothetical protein n=1 Tax=Pyruvatibacter sp. TaxID=1981328 RepID=UPI0032EF1FDB